MIKLITIDELRPGMFIHKLEVWWIKDQRIHNQMLITDPRQIATLRSEGIRQLWIDLDRSVQMPIVSPVTRAERPLLLMSSRSCVTSSTAAPTIVVFGSSCIVATPPVARPLRG